MKANQTDVMIIGYGPVGQALAIMLAQQGHSVVVVERKADPYPLPRAVCMDHEIRRVLLALGCNAVLDASARPSPTYRWLNAAHEELLNIDWTVEAISGGPEAYFFHQPSLEAAMQRRAGSIDAIDLRLGWEVREFQQDADGVSAVIHDQATEQAQSVRAKYLIGADGANSFVRRTLEIEQEDFGFEADWLVVDVSAADAGDFQVSGAVQICDPARPTTMVPGGVSGDRIYRRWEFMRLPGENKADLEDREKVWELLAPWVDRSKVELHKHVVYTFRSLIATEWRRERILLAGDAAHVMPPFMGQGMCSGLRDDWNLAWKLSLVLDGVCSESLLDTYAVERKDHVAAVIDSSVALGRIICVADQDEAAARDKAFFDGSAPPPAPFPPLRHGLIATEPRFAHLAGSLSPHSNVCVDGQDRRLDDATGRRFVLAIRGIDDRAAAVATLAGYPDLVSRIQIIGPEATTAPADRIAGFLEANGLAAYLARPDFYIYGTVTRDDEAVDLLHAFFRDLAPMLPAPAVAADDARPCTVNA